VAVQQEGGGMKGKTITWIIGASCILITACPASNDNPEELGRMKKQIDSLSLYIRNFYQQSETNTTSISINEMDVKKAEEKLEALRNEYNSLLKAGSPE
jgi:GTP cyclohydrolase FolE2